MELSKICPPSEDNAHLTARGHPFQAETWKPRLQERVTLCTYVTVHWVSCGVLMARDGQVKLKKGGI